jgi:hypothetical protein
MDTDSWAGFALLCRGGPALYLALVRVSSCEPGPSAWEGTVGLNANVLVGALVGSGSRTRPKGQVHLGLMNVGPRLGHARWASVREVLRASFEAEMKLVLSVGTLNVRCSVGAR